MNKTLWTPAWRRACGLLAAAVLACTAAVPAAAQGTDRQARVWAASCVTCHGTGGLANQAGIPPIAGRDADQLLRTLLEFKNGQRPAATVMHQHAKGYSDEELRRIAQVFAAQAPN
jgi:cytochrome subunit of sulfide dehydrogenase